MDGHNEGIMANGREDVGGHNEEVMAEGRGDVDGLEEEVAAVTGEGGVEEIDRSVEREDCIVDEDDVVRSMYLHDDCLPCDQLTWEIMFDKVENMIGPTTRTQRRMLCLHYLYQPPRKRWK